MPRQDAQEAHPPNDDGKVQVRVVPRASGEGEAAIIQSAAAIARQASGSAAILVVLERHGARRLAATSGIDMKTAEGALSSPLLAAPEPTIVHDLHLAHKDDPLAHATGMRFAALTPLTDPAGARWGLIVALDARPRQRTKRIVEALDHSARMLAAHLKLEQARQPGTMRSFLRAVIGDDGENEAETHRFLAEAGHILASSLDAKWTLDSLASLCVPRLADSCAVDLLDDGRIHRVSLADKDENKLRLSKELLARHPPDPASETGLPAVMRTGKAIFIPQVDHAALQGIAQNDEHLKSLEALETRSLAIVPLVGRTGILGALTLTTSGKDARTLTQADLDLSEQVARRAAIAIEHGRLFEATKALGERLADLVDGVDAILWEADVATGRFTFVSQRAEQILGHPVRAWLDDATFWREHIHPLDRQWTIARAASETKEARDHELEYRMIAADGRVVWMRDIVYLARDDQGAPLARRGIMIDVTRRKVNEERLAAQHAFTAMLAQATSSEQAQEMALEVIGAHLDVEFAALWRPDGERLHCVRTWVGGASELGEFERATSSQTFAHGEGLPGRAWAEARPVWAAHFGEDARFPRAAAATAAGLRTGIALPVMGDAGVHSIIEVFLSRSRGPDDALLDLLGGMGAQLGLVLEKRLTDAKIEEVQARRAAIVESSLDCVVTIDRTGRVTEWNPAAERTFGHTRNEALGQTMADLIVPPEFREAHTQGIARYLRDGEARVLGQRLELPAVRKDGTRLLVELSITRLPGAEPAFSGFLRDITERKRGAEELARTKHNLELILQSAGEGIYGVDPSGTTTFINDAALKMLGLKEDEAVGHKLHRVVHHTHPDGSPHAVEDCPIYQAARGAAPRKVKDDAFWRPDGTKLRVDYVTSPLVDQGRIVGAVTIFSDVTRRRENEEELIARAEKLARLADALERSNRELDQFAYVTSHDLKAPLRGIANLSRWIEEDMGDNVNPEVSSKLSLMRGRVNRMEALINAILEYSRVGRVREHVAAVDVEELVRETVELVSPPPGFQVHVDSPLPTVPAERTRLQQVFLNLIGNAIKHHGAGTGNVWIRSEDAGAFHRFSVRDDGRGISPKFHEKVFTIFQTLEARDKVEGTGVGLALVKKIVEGQGGRVTIESDEGKGATFTFTWRKRAQGDSYYDP